MDFLLGLLTSHQLLKVNMIVIIGSLHVTFFSSLQKVNISGCPQMTSLFLLLSVVPAQTLVNPLLKKNFINAIHMMERLNSEQFPPTLSWVPTFSYVTTVQELDISNCPRIHLGPVFGRFCKSFPKLRSLKASYLTNFRLETLWKWLRKCPMICKVDLTVDITPLIPSQVSIISSSQVMMPLEKKEPTFYKQYFPEPMITKLTLEGRTDIFGKKKNFLGFLAYIPVTDFFPSLLKS